tara:strand:+ start:691 stop:1092 length:402 start_codon:yes stop_codon:yes gene_type:complete
MLRFSSLLVMSFMLAGCADGAGSSGIGIDKQNLASVNPSQSLGAGPLTPQSLLGVAPSALSSRLGAPAFKRAEPGAEVWQYSGGDCALFVYFYKTGSGALASAYVDARKSQGGSTDTASCLSHVLSARGTPVS